MALFQGSPERFQVVRMVEIGRMVWRPLVPFQAIVLPVHWYWMLGKWKLKIPSYSNQCKSYLDRLDKKWDTRDQQLRNNTWSIELQTCQMLLILVQRQFQSKQMLNSSRQKLCWILCRRQCTWPAQDRTIYVIFQITIVQLKIYRISGLATGHLWFWFDHPWLAIMKNNTPSLHNRGKMGLNHWLQCSLQSWKRHWLHQVHHSCILQNICILCHLDIFHNKISIHLPSNIEESWNPTPDHFLVDLHLLKSTHP